MRPEVTAFFDEATNTISYVVVDPATKRCAVIDSVLDYDPDAAAHRQALGRSRSSTSCAEQRARASSGCSRPTSMPTICRPRPTSRQELGGKLGIGEQITIVQNDVRQDLQRRHRVPARRQPVRPCCSRTANASRLGETRRREVMHTPGHTPA